MARRFSLSRVLAALIVLAGVVVATIIVLTAPSPAAPSRALESIFQDDDHLIYASSATVTRTLDTLHGLGVQRIRATVLWRAIAPRPTSPHVPAGFDAANPADYSSSAWAPYDRLVTLARARGIGVDFDVGAPGPRWAMAPGAPDAKFATHWRPSARQFGHFVEALGRRYSGGFRAANGATLPRVSYWAIWNEPNQPGWLAPQWQRIKSRAVIVSARLYRGYVDAAYGALLRTGHGPTSDTILIGELAPEGSESPHHAYSEPIPPMPFLRALYCVGPNYTPLRGASARALGCPPSGAAREFALAHPGLFEVTGFAHHPYSLFLAPNVSMKDPNFVPLSNLGRLEHALDSIFTTYGVNRRLPLYLTEYGYGTDPPNPYTDVTPPLQAQYLNEAEYLAWKDPRVRALSQFLLYDSPPDTRYPRGSTRYWSTFQSGLLYLDGTPKPAFAAYRLPIFVPDPSLHGGRVPVWARIRPAGRSGSGQADIQWAPAGGPFRTVAQVAAGDPNDIVERDVALPGPGRLRIAWVASGGDTVTSRDVAVNAG